MIKGFALGLAGALSVVSAANAADLYTGGYAGGLKDVPVVSNDIIASNNQLSVQFVTTHFDYLETMDGQKLDSEGGWVPGVGVSFTMMNNWYVRNLYFNAQYSHVNSKTDYVGAYQGGTYGSVKTQDTAIVNDVDFRLGKGFELQQNFMATPYFGGGYHDWQRGGNGGEEYSHGYLGAGLLLQWSPISKFVLSGNGLIGGTFGSQVVVGSYYPNQPGGIVGSTLTLGDAATYRLGVSGDYALTQKIHLNAGVEWVHFSYGQSSLDPTGTYLEPDSRTNNTTVKVGAGYAFGGGYEPLK